MKTPECKTLGQMAFENYLKTPEGLRTREKACLLQDYAMDIIDAIQGGEKIPLFKNASWINNLQKYEYRIVWEPFKAWLELNQLSYRTIAHDDDFDVEVDFDHRLNFTLDGPPPTNQPTEEKLKIYWNPS